MAAKGQPIGGTAGPAAARERRRGGMLPPTGAGPVEVTPEWMEEQQRAASQSAAAAPTDEADQVSEQTTTTTPPATSPEPETAATAAVVPSPTQPEPARQAPAPAPAPAPVSPDDAAELPSESADPAEILSRCEQIILAARVEAEEKLRAVESAWLSKAGPAVRLVHRTKAYKYMLDGTGKPYRSFQRWAQERCGISRPHAYRMVSEGPVKDALAPIYAGPLATRQVDVLGPILRQHGEDAVRRVWSAAESTGGTGAKQLEVKRDVLGLLAAPEDHEPPRDQAVVTPVAALAHVQKAVVSSDRAVLKEAAKASPEAARQTMLAALKLASDLQSVLGELGEPAT